MSQILYTEDGQKVSASNPLPVTSSGGGGTQDTNLTQIGGTNASVNAGNADAGTQRVVIATDQTPFQVETVPGAALNTESSALGNSIVVKGSAGTLYELVITNTNASAQLIQLHDATSLPSNGAVPVKSFYVGANQSVSYTPIGGVAFSTGIVAANSSTAATLTVGGADCWFDARYQ